MSLLPLIQEQASYACRERQAEEREDFIAEVVANAYVAFVRLAQQGKLELAYATPLTQVRHFGWTGRGRLRFPLLARILTSD